MVLILSLTKCLSSQVHFLLLSKNCVNFITSGNFKQKQKKIKGKRREINVALAMPGFLSDLPLNEAFHTVTSKSDVHT